MDAEEVNTFRENIAQQFPCGWSGENFEKPDCKYSHMGTIEYFDGIKILIIYKISQKCGM